MTYPPLAAALVGLALAVALVVRRRVAWLAVAVAAGVLAVLTVVFDNLMIAAGLFTFGEGTTAGLRIGRMPLEDLAYPAATVLLLPALWHVLEARRRPPAPAERAR